MTDVPKIGAEYRVAWKQDDTRLIYGPWSTPLEAKADYENIKAKVDDHAHDLTYVALYFCGTLIKEHSE